MPFFAMMQKKIVMPNNNKLRVLSWNPEHDAWLAAGGDECMLKVLKLDVVATEESNVRGVAAPTALTMNQQLDGHKGAVVLASWNVKHRKLATADATGLIIVWVKQSNNTWVEEMINSRNKSVVKDLRWRSDGEEICIAYEDGTVILGTAEGARLWAKDVGSRLSLVEWSPHGQQLLFAAANGPVLIFNRQGVRVGAVALPGGAPVAEGEPPAPPAGARVVALEWYDGAEGVPYSDGATLAVALSSGVLLLLRSAEDEAPLVVNTGTRALIGAKWNSNGTFLAALGRRLGEGGKEQSAVQFYTPHGRLVHTLAAPAGATSLAWEGGGLRLALSVDSLVYFVNVRPSYPWATFGDCVVYAFSQVGRDDQCVMFWDTATDGRHLKHVHGLLALSGAGEFCALVAAAPAPEEGAPATAGRFIVVLCNSIGSAVETRYINVEPMHMCMTPSCVVVASRDALYMWSYRAGGGAGARGGGGGGAAAAAGAASPPAARRDVGVGKERVFSVADVSVGATAASSGEGEGGAARLAGGDGDICCVAASARWLLVGRESGAVQLFSLPGMVLEQKFQLRVRPASLQLNCDGTRFSVIDDSCTLSFFDMTRQVTNASGGISVGEHLEFEKAGVWSIVWSEDYPHLWAIMEKTRMYVYRGDTPEEPVTSSGYIFRFNDLTITSLLLDDLLAVPEEPTRDFLVVHEVRSLRDTRTLLLRNTLRDCISFVEDNAHPRLWKILAETAIDRLDLAVAEKAFVARSDYPGIQFVKRLRLLGDRAKQRAEVLASFNRIGEAEAALKAADRADLAVELRMRVGDWRNVLELLKAGGGGDDELLRLAQNRLGDSFADSQRWAEAIPLYQAAGNSDALAEAYYVVEDYDALAALAASLPEGAPLLRNIGGKLQSVGLVEPAATALLRGGDGRAAVDVCVALHQWDRAVELAEAQALPGIEDLLNKYAEKLLAEGKHVPAVELYRKARREAESARLLAKLAAEVGDARTNPVRAKWLFVMAAMDVEKHRRRGAEAEAEAGAGGATAAGAAPAQRRAGHAVGLDALLKEDATAAAAAAAGAGAGGGGNAAAAAAATTAAAAARTLDRAWHGAEAYHFTLLAQRLLYAGDMGGAMAAALRLTLYEDVLDPRDVHALVALTAFYNRCYATSSRAFVKLENMETLAPDAREAYADLAVAIFSRARPADPLDDATNSVICAGDSCKAVIKAWATKCAACGLAFRACVATGRPLRVTGPGSGVLQCRLCKHFMSAASVAGRASCPLCHAGLAAV